MEKSPCGVPNDSTNVDSTECRRQVVVVVHGVGVDTAGVTVRELAASFAGQSQNVLPPNDETLWITEPDDIGERLVRTFPAHVCRLKGVHREVVFYEVFWGDISRLTGNIVGALKGLIDVIFGLRYAARYAAEPDGRKTCLSKLCGAVAWMLHGPVVAINLFLALATLAAVLTRAIVRTQTAVDGISDAVAASVSLEAANASSDLVMCGLGLIVTALCFWRTQRPSKVQRDWWWIDWSGIAIGLITVLISVPAHFGHSWIAHQEHSFNWYGRLLIQFMVAIWTVIAGIQLMAFLTMAITWKRVRPTAKPGILAGFIITSLSASLWGLVIPTAWVTLLNLIPADLRVTNQESLLNEALHFIGVLWLNAVLFVMIGGLTFFSLWRWAEKNTAATVPPDGTNHEPRLILGKLLSWFLIVNTVLWSLAAINAGWKTVFNFSIVDLPWVPAWIGKGFRVITSTRLNHLAIVSMGTIGLLVGYFASSLRIVLEIVLDVVNHFRLEWTATVPTQPGGSPVLKRSRQTRRRIAGRLKAVLEAIPPDIRRQSELTLVSHSQGTIVVADALANPEQISALADFRVRSWVTMGSPLTHLYQYYFTGEYPPFTDAHWHALQDPQRLCRWVNIYRIDDFVGTRVLGATTDRPVNQPVDRGGHTGYWNDFQVILKLIEFMK